MFTFAVVFLAWCALSVPLGILIGHVMAASDRLHAHVPVQDPRARRAA